MGSGCISEQAPRGAAGELNLTERNGGFEDSAPSTGKWLLSLEEWRCLLCRRKITSGWKFMTNIPKDLGSRSYTLPKEPSAAWLTPDSGEQDGVVAKVVLETN